MKKYKKQFVLNVGCVLLFCVFRVDLSVCFYRPFYHVALKPDPI